jgi:ABC-type multidrug transport system fused ATPase/permease subunit
MLNLTEIVNYFKALSASIKFQIAATISFGVALVLGLFTDYKFPIIVLAIFFLFAVSVFILTIAEKVLNAILRRRSWENLTPQEEEFIGVYLKKNEKVRYMYVFNGTYRDSGIINPLISKGILYRASNMSEYRGKSWQSMNQYIPINMHDRAFSFFMKKASKDK